MASLPAQLLIKAVEEAFADSGANAVCVPPEDEQPRKFFVQSGQLSFSVWFYMWTLTHGGGSARPKNEYRIQLTGVKPPLATNPDGSTVMIGYEPNTMCFAGFDLTKHRVFSTKSPSIQININAVHAALRDGLSFTTKGNEEIAIAFRPDQILTYALHAELLHAQGADANTVALLRKATGEVIIPENELAALPKERQRVIQTVAALSRDNAFKRKVVVAYDRKCAVTGIQLRLIDAAHILPVGATGSNDEVNNGLCLSPTYHRAYDRGLIYLDENRIMRLNNVQTDHLIALKLHGGLESFKAPLGHEIFLPPDRNQWPHSTLIRRANEFRKIPL